MNQLNKFMKMHEGYQSPQHSGRTTEDPEHINLLMAQLFLADMLKSKCTRLKEKFNAMENNFERIKKGVRFEEENMVGKFLSQN